MAEILGPRGAVAWRRSIISQADAAQRRGDWSGAARLYETALARNPSRAEIWIQLGHCRKRLREFHSAYEANSRANAIQATADGYLQLGHLLRITGNIYGSFRAYEVAAGLGDPAALQIASELEAITLPSLRLLLSETELQDGKAANGPLVMPDGSLGKIRLALAWCEHDLRDIERLRATAYLLLGVGLLAPARAFFELSFVWEGFSPDAQARHMAIALRTGLWGNDGPLVAPVGAVSGTVDEMLRQLWRLFGEEAVEAEEDQRDIEVFLRAETQLFAAPRPPGAAASQGNGHEERQVSVDFVTHPAEDPVALIAEVYRGLAGAADDPSLFAGLKDLSQAVLAASPVVSFGEELAADAGRVLFNGLQYFLRKNRQPIAGPFASPQVLGTLWRIGMDRAVEPPAADERNESLPQALLRLIQASKDEKGRYTLEKLVAVIRQRLPLDGLEECAEKSCDVGFLRVTGLLLDRIVSEPSRRTPEFLLWASELLKRNGAWTLALDLARKAAALAPSPDALNALAILEKTCGNFERAIAILERRLAEDPQDESVLSELLMILPEREDVPSILARFAGKPKVREIVADWPLYRLYLEPNSPDNGAARFAAGRELAQLAPELTPQLVQTLDLPLSDRIKILQLGRERRNTPSGTLPVLRGIEAVRARIKCSTAVVAMRIKIDGRTIARITASEATAAMLDLSVARRAYLFNVWIDLSEVAIGLHEVQLFFEEKSGGYQIHNEFVYIDRPLMPEAHPCSGAVIRLDGGATEASLEERINALPSVVYPANRRCFAPPLDRILIVRTDQLGDFVCSIPAIFRLHEMFPTAQFVGLMGPANSPLAEELGVFARIVTVDLCYDPVHQLRLLPLREQSELKRQLQEFSFDLAIDLSPAFDSRPFLRLSGARHTIGFNPHEFPWLTFGIDAVTHDPVNGKECVPHSMMSLALVEAFSTYLNHRPLTLPLPAASRTALVGYGVHEDKPYLLLHCGARLRMKRWPLAHYIELARLSLAKTELDVVTMADTRAEVEEIENAGLDASGRFRCVAGPVPFADLDALVANCAVFVGNDTGPKHLAALRGAKVVSVHMGQVNWNEWGQEGDGLIVTRRVPCYGCGIEEAEACGKGLPCLVHIRPEEVLAAVQQLLEK